MVDHLIVHCDVTKKLWELLLSISGVHWVMPSSKQNLLEYWVKVEAVEVGAELVWAFRCKGFLFILSLSFS